MTSRTRRRGRSAGVEAHVRLYAHELACPAWRALTPDARALLIELRAVFSPKSGDNRVFLSIREAMDRIGVGQRRAAAARDELIERGWITIAERGAFARKVRHATVYALENLGPAGDERDAAKPFLRWQPGPRFSTVAKSARHGSRDSYRDQSGAPEKGSHGSRDSYRRGDSEPITVAGTATQIQLPSGAQLDRDALLLQSSLAGVAPSVRTMMTAAWLLTRPEARA